MKEKCYTQNSDKIDDQSNTNLITNLLNDDFNDVNNFDECIMKENVFLSSDDEDESNFDENINTCFAIDNNLDEANSSNSGEKRKNEEQKSLTRKYCEILKNGRGTS